MATSKECPFYLGRTSKERHAELYAEIEAKFPRVNQKETKTGPTRRSGGSRKKVGFSNPDAEGFVQVGVTPGIARIDRVPSKPSPLASIKPPGGSVIGAITDEALRPELRGNEEARRLMQETILDEAAFAAADAVAPSGSPLCLFHMPKLCLLRPTSLIHALRSKTYTSQDSRSMNY